MLLADEAASPSARSPRVEAPGARPAAGRQLAGRDGALGDADLRRALGQIASLGTFFGRLAATEAVPERRGYWEDLRLGYAAAAGRLGRLLDGGGLTIADLPAGREAAAGATGIVIDADLDGAWPAGAAEADDWRRLQRLSGTLFEGLAALEGHERWIWFDAHLKRSPTAGVMEPGSEAVAGPLLTRYWFAKDRHLRASAAVQAADESGQRVLWTARRDALAGRARAAVEAARPELGEAWHAALAANWQQQAASAEAFAAAFAEAGAEAGAGSSPGPRAAPEPRDAGRGEEITALRDRLAELEGRIGKLGSQLRDSRDEASRLERELSAARDPAGRGAEDRLSRAAAELEAERRANRERIAELEAHLSALIAQLEESRSEIGRYQTQIQENQEALTRYRAEMRATGEELSRYREELDAAQDRQAQSILSLTRSFSSGQSAMIGLGIGLGVVLLLLSTMTIAVLLRRTSAAVPATAPVPATSPATSPATGPATAPATARHLGGSARRSDGRAIAPSARATTEPCRAESEALAARKEPPRDRLLALAGGRIEIALPILARSEALTDADLLEIIGRTTARHRIAIASRRRLNRQVVDALVATGETRVAAVLVENAGAEITPGTFGQLAGQAEDSPALRSALLGRPGLPAGLRARLTRTAEPPESPPAADAEAAREDQRRRDMAGKLLAAAAEIDAAAAAFRTARDAAAEGKAGAGAGAGGEPARETAAEDAAPCQVASGAVAPHALIEALRQGKLELFEALFGKMTGLGPPRLQQVIYGAGGQSLAIACRALGLDKPLMTSIFIWSRKGRADLGAVNPRELSSAMTVFDETSPEAAQETTQAWLQGEAIPGEWDRRLHGPAAE